MKGKDKVIDELLDNNGFWTLSGIILGGVITHVFWYLQRSGKQIRLFLQTEFRNLYRHRRLVNTNPQAV